MSHRSALTKLLAASLAASALAAPAASADAMLAPATGGQNLAAGGGWFAWSAPAADGGHKLVLRAPDGTVSEPAVPRFGAPVDPAIGANGLFAEKKLLVVYSRCEGASATAGCDVWALDTTDGTESKVKRLASGTYSETAPSLSGGSYTFVRRGGGSRKGVHYLSRKGALRRVSPTLATETQFNGSRVAYVFRSAKGAGVIVRRASGDGAVFTAASRLSVTPTDLGLTRYQAIWRQGKATYYTTRFGGSGGPHAPVTRTGSRELADGASLAIGASTIRAYALDAEGLKQLNPTPFK